MAGFELRTFSFGCDRSTNWATSNVVSSSSFKAVLDGYGWLLKDQSSRLPHVNKFLKKVPEYQASHFDHLPSNELA